MKTIHRTALFATALCALVAAPAAFAGEPLNAVSQYIDYAKQLKAADAADATNVVKSAVAEVVKAAGDSAQQAAGEIAAALAAVSTVTTDSDSAAAGALFENVVAAASAAGSDKAESLALAKVAAATGAFVSGGADYVSGAGAGLSKSVAKEVKNALSNADEVLAGLDFGAIKEVYEAAVEALRPGSYKMKGDDDSLAITAAEVAAGASSDAGTGADVTGFDSRNDSTTPPSDGVFVGGAPAPVEPVVVPTRKKRHSSPTPHGKGND